MGFSVGMPGFPYTSLVSVMQNACDTVLLYVSFQLGHDCVRFALGSHWAVSQFHVVCLGMQFLMES